MNNISKYLFRILSLVLIFLPLSFVHADVNLTSEGKVPGGPFTYLQEQIDDVELQIDNIELIPGPVGPQGPIGLTGNIGLKGDKGDKGDQGIQGIQGVAGTNGIDGTNGTNGADGAAGADGVAGADGAIGGKGDKGDKGDIGDTGPKGDKGDQGDPGPAFISLQEKIRNMATLLGKTGLVSLLPTDALSTVHCSKSGGSITVTFAGTSFSGLMVIGSEAISRLYDFSVLFSSSTAMNASTYLGQDVAVSVMSGGLSATYAGVVTQAGSAGFDSGQYLYAIKISHVAERLTRGTSYRVFLSTKSTEIINQILSENAIGALVVSTNELYPHSVQWEESSMNFITRLMEREGLLYYFNNGQLTITAPGSAYPAVPMTTNYNGHLMKPVAGTAAATTLSIQSSISGGTFSARSYDYRTGSAIEASATIGSIADSYVVYQEDKSQAELQVIANNLRDRSGEFQNWVRGTSNNPSYRAGYTATVSDNTGGTLSDTYLLTSVYHLAYRDSSIGCVSYANLFNGKSNFASFLPQHQAIKPKATLTTAIVTNNQDPDSLGRIKVKYLRGDLPVESHWVRFSTEAKLVIKSITEQLINPEATALPIPTLPDIDDEVVVGFLGGDPDKPIVLGFVRTALDAADYGLYGR